MSEEVPPFNRYLGKILLYNSKSKENYGYFINLPSEIVGLLHINNNPDKLTFEIGDTITVNVIDIDLEGERLSLSLTPLEKH